MKRRDLLILTLALSSCIGILPKHGEIIEFVPVNFSKGIKIIINEIPRGIGKNVTIVECYDIDKQKMLKKEQVGWKTTVGLELNCGTYIIKTYCPYLGKIIYPTEDKVTVDNNIISIEIKYPLPRVCNAWQRDNGTIAAKKQEKPYECSRAFLIISS